MAATPRRPTSRVMTQDPNRAAEVYFDGGCPVCSREIAVYRKRMADAGIDWKAVSWPAKRPPISAARTPWPGFTSARPMAR